MPSLVSRLRLFTMGSKSAEDKPTSRMSARAAAAASSPPAGSDPVDPGNGAAKRKSFTGRVKHTLSAAFGRNKAGSAMPPVKRGKSILRKGGTQDETELDASPEHPPPVLPPVETPKSPQDSNMWDSPTEAHRRAAPLREASPGIAVRDAMLAVHGAPLADRPLPTGELSPPIPRESSPAPPLSNLSKALSRIGLAVADLAPSNGTAAISPDALQEPPSRAPPSSPKPPSDGAQAPETNGTGKRRAVPVPQSPRPSDAGGGGLTHAGASLGDASQGTSAGAAAPPGEIAPSAEGAGGGGRGGASPQRQRGGSRAGSLSPSRGGGAVADRAGSFMEGGGAGAAGVGREGQNPGTPSEQTLSMTPKAGARGAVAGGGGGGGKGGESAGGK
ncbi:hypothetical protein T484DRAFT_1878722 [Baffinella frigidus]|nr:hypothetical protein T484DRAFT_1878722 [Cryptophyta sp. CCMP2293]